MTPTVQLRTIYEVKQLVPTTMHKVHKHLPLMQLIITFKFSFRNTQKCVTSATGLTGQCDNRYSQPAYKGTG